MFRSRGFHLWRALHNDLGLSCWTQPYLPYGSSPFYRAHKNFSDSPLHRWNPHHLTRLFPFLHEETLKSSSLEILVVRPLCSFLCLLSLSPEEDRQSLSLSPSKQNLAHLSGPWRIRRITKQHSAFPAPDNKYSLNAFRQNRSDMKNAAVPALMFPALFHQTLLDEMLNITKEPL